MLTVYIEYVIYSICLYPAYIVNGQVTIVKLNVYKKIS